MDLYREDRLIRSRPPEEDDMDLYMRIVEASCGVRKGDPKSQYPRWVKIVCIVLTIIGFIYGFCR